MDERGDNNEREENSEEDRESVLSDTQTVASNDSNDYDGRRFNKRKYTHHIPPPSEIKTRGAKLPKYSFERKTHKKILMPASEMSEGSTRQAARNHSFVMQVNLNWYFDVLILAYTYYKSLFHIETIYLFYEIILRQLGSQLLD